ncbi:hypothetical protein DM819_21740 [Pseudomonas hunanensis]|uniref:Uncharacterized protein n=1 Tax=Pseudomonas hunanensis TaxID=1247546 RepID=A0ABD6N7X3_9PSED|nr:hypothetical protein [Pseudomonas hunanensis]NWL48415.1 hypothetical protein [Pseudomonas hunanensis]
MDQKYAEISEMLDQNMAATNALMAVVSGLISHIKETQGMDGVRHALDKTNHYSKLLTDQPGMAVDQRVIASVFQHGLT